MRGFTRAWLGRHRTSAGLAVVLAAGCGSKAREAASTGGTAKTTSTTATTSTPAGDAGAGAAGGTTGSTQHAGGGGAGGAPGTGGAGGAGGATNAGGSDGGASCVGCGKLLAMPDAGAETPCPEAGVKLQAYRDCICKTKCAAVCGDNACAQKAEAPDCTSCVSSSCQDEYFACMGDK